MAFLSPHYFASEVGRREWKSWIDQEIAKHILTEGAAPIYIVEVPAFLSKPPLSEHAVAREVAKLCGLAGAPAETVVQAARLPCPTNRQAGRLHHADDRFALSVSSLVKEFRRRQLNAVQPFYNASLAALQRDDLREVLRRLAQDLDQRAEQVRKAADSENTVPPYNRKFTGRLDELVELRCRLKDDRSGVIAGIHGLGGIGKTELAYTYAHAFAGAYPGGRFPVRCEGESDLRQAVLRMEQDPFHDEVSDEERKQPGTHFAAVLRCVWRRPSRSCAARWPSWTNRSVPSMPT